jgi:hypothetical protein
MIEPKQTEDQPKQFDREHILLFFRKFRFVSVCFETVLFVSVVSIKVRNTETNQNKPKIFVFGFTKQTKTQPKQILFWFVSVRTKKIFCMIRGHSTPRGLHSNLVPAPDPSDPAQEERLFYPLAFNPNVQMEMVCN